MEIQNSKIMRLVKKLWILHKNLLRAKESRTERSISKNLKLNFESDISSELIWVKIITDLLIMNQIQVKSRKKKITFD